MKIRATLWVMVDHELTPEQAAALEVNRGMCDVKGGVGEEAWLFGMADQIFDRVVVNGEVMKEGDFFDWSPVCRECGCTNDHACDGGCAWVEPDLCSTHVPGAAPA